MTGGYAQVNPDSLKYAVNRLSQLKIADVTQRLKLKIRHHNIQRAYLDSHESFSLASLVKKHGNWLHDPHDPSIIKTSLLNSCSRNLGSLNLGSQDLWDSFSLLYKSHSDELRRRASSILDGRITIFGWLELDLGSEIDWCSCFEPNCPNENWPNQFYWLSDFSGKFRGLGGDIKTNWEVNRLQFLLTLGACHRLFSDPVYSKRAREILESWMDSVIYPVGPQWSSNLEVAIRALSMVRSCLVFADSAYWQDEFFFRVIASIELHLNHLENELSIHHTEGNHLLGESASLLQISLLCPFLKRSDKRIQISSRILDSLIPRLILPDGIYAEQSVSYAKFILEFLVPLMGPRESRGSILSPGSRELVRKCLRSLNEISNENGLAPMIGDSDSGSALGLYLDDYWDMRPLMACGAKIFDDPDLLRKVKDLPAESFLIFGKEIQDWFETNHSRERNQSSALDETQPSITHFTHGGLIKATYKSLVTMFDVGPLGKAPGYEHGHSDGLSVQLWIDNKPLLIDSGTFIYNGNPQWRKYFKGSAAHNVLQVDQLDQSRPLGSFRWAFSPAIHQIHVSTSQDQFCLSGAIKLESATWKRYVTNLSESVFLILDELECKPDCEVGLNLVFDPSWRVEVCSGDAVAGEEKVAGLELFGWKPRSARLMFGSEDEIGGWISRLYGKLEKTFQIRAASEAGRIFYSGVMIGKRLESLSVETIRQRVKLIHGAGLDEGMVDWFMDVSGKRDPGDPIIRYRLFGPEY